MTRKELHNELVKDMENLKLPEGYTKYVQSEEDRTWGFIITPSDNVLYVQADQFKGYTFSLQYVPSKEHGTGCQAETKQTYELTEKILKEAEKNGMAFAYQLKAKRFPNSQTWLNKYWAKDTLKEIKEAQ